MRRYLLATMVPLAFSGEVIAEPVGSLLTCDVWLYNQAAVPASTNAFAERMWVYGYVEATVTVWMRDHSHDTSRTTPPDVLDVAVTEYCKQHLKSQLSNAAFAAAETIYPKK